MAEGVRHDYSPIGMGKNWVTEVGGLPPMIRDIAHALIRDGHDESSAIQLAVGAVQRWARGEGGVKASTRARAAAAISQWEAMKTAAHAKSAGKRDAGTITEQGSAGLLLPKGPIPKGPRLPANADVPHAYRGTKKERKCSVCGMGPDAQLHLLAPSGKRAFNPDEPREHGKWSKGLDAVAHALGRVAHAPGSGASINARTGEEPHDGFMVAEAGKSHIAKPEELTTHENRKGFLARFLKGNRSSFADPDKHIGIWHDADHSEVVLDPSDHIADRDEAIRQGVARNQQSIYDVAGNQEIDTGGTGDRDTATNSSDQASLDSEVDRGHDGRGNRSVRGHSGDSLGAGVRPDSNSPDGARREGSSSPAVALVDSLLGEGWRADISKHPSAVRPAEDAVKKRLDAKQAFATDADTIEPQLHSAITELFEKQRKATISRLTGRRGRQMLRGNRSDPPPPQDDETATASESPDPSAIFDPTFWAAETAKVAQPILDRSAQLGRGQVRTHLGPAVNDETDETGSLSAVDRIMRDRANRMAGQVTDTTFGQIRDTLADGVRKGEPLPALTDRVQHVFDVARSRASNIARTETIGSLNQAAYTYADNLPPDVVGRKEWAAHHDNRTRMTHRIADGQTVPMDTPFIVGGFPMQFPGDPAAPPDEVCQCRCTLLYKPADKALNPAREAA